jgi:hypothetical protein
VKLKAIWVVQRKVFLILQTALPIESQEKTFFMQGRSEKYLRKRKDSNRISLETLVSAVPARCLDFAFGRPYQPFSLAGNRLVRLIIILAYPANTARDRRKTTTQNIMD